MLRMTNWLAGQSLKRCIMDRAHGMLMSKLKSWIPLAGDKRIRLRFHCTDGLSFLVSAT